MKNLRKSTFLYSISLAFLSRRIYSQNARKTTQEIFKITINNKLLSVNIGDLTEEITDAIGYISHI